MGCGYIGTCVAAVLADRGHDVVGVDVRPRVVQELMAGRTHVSEPELPELIASSVRSGRLSATCDFAVLRDVAVILVTVGTPLGDAYSADTSQIVAATRSIATHLRKGHLVIIKSTLPPGTTERTVLPLLEQGSGLKCGIDFHLAFCPERIAEGRALQELRSIPVVVGGIDDTSTRLASAFWAEALGVATVQVHGSLAAELVKLADNLWIDVNIAVAHELAMLGDKLGLDILEVIAAANTLPKGGHSVNILAPSMGVGGSCLTKDPWFIHALGRDHGLELRLPVVSRAVNDQMPIYAFELIKAGLGRIGRPLADSKVAVLGIAYKSDTGDCRFTPTRSTVELLEQAVGILTVCDPLVTAEEARTVTQRVLSSSIEEAIVGADCVAFLTGHALFKQFSIDRITALVKPGCLIFDGRMYFDRAQIDHMRSLGLNYKGIGR